MTIYRRRWHGLAGAAALVLSVGCAGDRSAGVAGTGGNGSGGGGNGSGGGGIDGSSDAVAVVDAAAVDVPGPFTAWMPCASLALDGPMREPFALAASTDGRWLAMLESVRGLREFGDQAVLLWHLPGLAVARRIANVSFGSLAMDVDLSPDGTRVAITGDGAEMVRTDDGTVAWEHPPPPDVPSDGWVRNFAFSPDGKSLASSRSHQIELFRAGDGTLITQLDSNGACLGVAVSPDGEFLASSGPRLWRLGQMAPLWSGPPPPAKPNLLFNITDHWAAFSPDGSLILIQSAFQDDASGFTFTTSTQIVDARNGELKMDLGKGLPRRPTFSPDGRWLVAGDRLINLPTGQTSSLAIPAVASVFLGDGRIFAAERSGPARLLCPQ